MYRPLFLFLLVGLLVPSRVDAQTLVDRLSQLPEPYAREYVRPMADAAGADLNAGLFHAARFGDDRLGFHVYVGVKMAGMLVPSDDRSLSFSYVDSLTLNVEMGSEEIPLTLPVTISPTDTPSALGTTAAGEATVQIDHDTTLTYLGVRLPASVDTTFTQRTVGGVVNTGIAPLLIPQIGVGTLFGTDLMIRWLPKIRTDKLGKVGMVGVSVRHSLSQYFLSPPIDVAIQAAWQRALTTDNDGNDTIEATTAGANIAISKEFGVLTLYGGLQMERSTVDIQYEYTLVPDGASPRPVTISMEDPVRMRGTLGFSLQGGPVHFNSDFSVGRTNVVSAGLGVMF